MQASLKASDTLKASPAGDAILKKIENWIASSIDQAGICDLKETIKQYFLDKQNSESCLKTWSEQDFLSLCLEKVMAAAESKGKDSKLSIQSKLAYLYYYLCVCQTKESLWDHTSYQDVIKTHQSFCPDQDTRKGAIDIKAVINQGRNLKRWGKGHCAGYTFSWLLSLKKKNPLLNF